MNKMNDFENMCKELNERKVCNNHICIRDNEYICARNSVKKYVDGDRNKLLKLKGEAITSDWWVFISSLLNILAVIASILALVYTVFCEGMGITSLDKTVYGILIIFAFIFYLLFVGHYIKKYQCVSKWKGYILVAIEELSKKW